MMGAAAADAARWPDGSRMITAVTIWGGALVAALAVASADAPRSTHAAAHSCVPFRSPEKLMAGMSYRAPIGGGLEFRLSADWRIAAGPADDPTVDYMEVVSPPVRTAPHLLIGAGYGLTASESAAIKRPLRYVVNRGDYEAARRAHQLPSASETLARLKVLGRGSVKLTIRSFQIRNVLPDGTPVDVFEWINFAGEACIDR